MEEFEGQEAALPTLTFTLTLTLEDFEGQEGAFGKARAKVMERLGQCLAQYTYQTLFWRFNKTRDGYLTVSAP